MLFRRSSSRFTGVIVAATGIALLAAAAASAPATTASAASGSGKENARLAQTPWRPPIDGQQFYFALTDRFADGDPSNNHGGLPEVPSESGYDPANPHFYHGGDLKGLEKGLDYIAGLGTDAIWITPPMKNQPVMVFFGFFELASYHGYWTLDLTSIDPHLGGDEAMRQLIAAAHQRDIKVYFDIEINTTADVIKYADQNYDYIPIEQEPWRDAEGNPIDIAELAGQPFPELDAASSFPHEPVIPEGLENAKKPDWLNDPTLYHNRGDSTFVGESVTYGDFLGLDDLMTEHPRVVEGMIDVYTDWIDFGADGFRIDTAKHVNMAFWQEWSAAIMDHARKRGRDDFFMFGEVLTGEQEQLAPYVRDTDIGGVLDFAFAGAAEDFVKGGSPTELSDFFDQDALYLTPQSSAYGLETFVSNHDLGRIGKHTAGQSHQSDRVRLAHDLMMLTRGVPIIYYGDEQGFAGGGTDENGNPLAEDVAGRQDMFRTSVPGYQEQRLVGGEPFGSGSHYDTDHPFYQRISELSELRQKYPALARGAQVELAVGDPTKGVAFARIDREEKREHVVAFNNTEEPQVLTMHTLTPGTKYEPLTGADKMARSTKDGSLTLTVPAFGTVVMRADEKLPAPGQAMPFTLTADVSGDRYVKLDAAVDKRHWYETSFAWRANGADEWVQLGTSDRSAPSVFHDIRGLEPGTVVEYVAVTTDVAGKHVRAKTQFTIP